MMMVLNLIDVKNMLIPPINLWQIPTALEDSIIILFLIDFYISIAAFLNMLENPNNTQQWLTDQDTGPMLIQISRIYYSERNVSWECVVCNHLWLS